ncbi:MAG: hypothetical protein JW913_11945 [Chitinispirillaceae bacterium]|nr:hypothetical protein [Chitinispirillaceae bacterium]
MNPVLTGCLLLLAANGPVSAGIVFQRESVDALISACDTLEIRGTYIFVNDDSASASTTIFYPFPVDSALEYPHYISCFNLSEKRPVKYLRKHDGINWNMAIAPRAADSVRVIYRQKTRRPQGRYILTTTRYWAKPLEVADFSVTTAEPATLEYWSFQYDSLSVKKDRITYHARKLRFYPDEDMLLRWKCGK